QGLGYRSVSKMLGLNEGTVKGYSQLYRSGDEITWVDNEHKRSAPDPKVLLEAVREYLEGRYGYRYLSIKYGLRDSTIKKAVKNYQTHGIVTLSKGRPTMEALRAQKAQLQQRQQQQDEKLLSKKDHKELLDLLEVNIALLEVIEECDPDEVKKKITGSK
ncbi:MAG: helix-turn-helix domain-containing protein, partial [Sutterellaceae bacterium]|nr:helix-turn-helix domain-containing protein [Sutterellaceae bacterium]